MPDIANGCELSIIPCKQHEGGRQANLGHHIQKRNFACEHFIKAKRAFEVAFLDPVLEPGQGLSGLELATCHVSSGAASDLVQKLQATTSQMRLACARRAIQEEWLPLTCELQSQLLDITFAFSENLDSWQHVRCHSGLLVEDDCFLLLGGGAIGN